MKKPIIAVAQIRYWDLNKRHNVDKIKRYIRKAKSKGADIVCFPESCVYKTENMRFDDQFIKDIKQECKKNQIWCIISENFILDKKTYNLALLIDRSGKIRGKYKKIHLQEGPGYYSVRPGKKVHVFQTDFATIGILICWDLAFPESFRSMKKAGAEIVFCPAQWLYEKRAYKKKHKEQETKLLKSLVRARAFENLFFVVLCNPVFDDEELISYSAISSPHRILKDIVDEEGLIIAEINLNDIKRYQKIYKKKL